MSPAAKAVKNETLSIMSFDDDLRVRNCQAHQPSVSVRPCLQLYITYIEIEAARSCGSHRCSSDSYIRSPALVPSWFEGVPFKSCESANDSADSSIITIAMQHDFTFWN
jgi:hypothetical protein